MEYVITEERKQYLSSKGKVIVNACPGSGKTTSVAYKLNTLIQNWEHKYSGIACISFTNVAKDEINKKYNEFTGKSISYPHIVSTIDSFINQYITLPHYHILGYATRPTILEDYTVLDSLPWYTLNKYKISSKPVRFKYPPSKIDIATNGTFLFDGKVPNLNQQNLNTFNKYCSELKNLQFRKGLLKNSDSLYIALKVLKDNPKIVRQLVSRFSYFIIDEAQDTSKLQHLIIDNLIKNGLEHIELIGDPYQSLYEWREARPDLFIEKTESGEWTPLEMTECRRSVQAIVKAYSIFRMKEHDNLSSYLPDRTVEKPVHVIYYTNTEKLIYKYEELSSDYNKNVVLVRGKKFLRELNAISSDIDYWKPTPFSPLQFIHAKAEMNNGNTKASIARIYKNIPALFDPDLSNDYIRKKEYLEMNNDNYELKSRLLLLIKKLPSYEKTLSEWTTDMNELCKEVLDLNTFPSFTLKQGKYRPDHRKSVRELFSQPVNYSKVTTIHKVKGKTFDSIMLVLSSNSSGQNLSLNDFKKPSEMPNEKKRLLYVAMSRPKWQLVIAIPNESRLTEEQELLLFGSNPIVHELH